MEKRAKIGILVVAISAGIIVPTIFLVFWEKPQLIPPFIPLFLQGPPHNTYVYNSTVNNLLFAIKLTKGRFLIENNYFISVNGTQIMTNFPDNPQIYNIINSTVYPNSTINLTWDIGSFSLHGNGNVTMKNIWNSQLSIYLHDQSVLSIQNCSLNYIYVFDTASLNVVNSSVYNILDKLPNDFSTSSNWKSYQTSISCINSTITYLEKYYSGTLSIKNSSIMCIWVFPYYNHRQVSIVGTIENATISILSLGGAGNFNVYNSTITSFQATQSAHVTLNECNVTNTLEYGIIAYSGSTNITTGGISGTGFVNNTKIINSTVPIPICKWVHVNNSAIVRFKNHSNEIVFQLFDSASLFISQSKTFPYSSNAWLWNSSSIVISNSSLNFGCYCYDKSSAIIQKNSTITDARCDDSSSVNIDNASISQVLADTLPSKDVNNLSITNSNITTMKAWATSVIHVENCTIGTLWEGLVVYSGSIILTPSGISGTGNYKNTSTTIINTPITTRLFRYLEVIGIAQLTVKDMFVDFETRIRDRGKLFLINSTIFYSINFDFSSTIAINSSLNSSTGIVLLMAFGNSYLEIENSIISCPIFSVLDNCRAYLTNVTSFYLIEAYDSSIITVKDSWISEANVCGSNSRDYSLKIYNSTVDNLNSYTW